MSLLAHHGLMMRSESDVLWTPADLASPASIWLDDQSVISGTDNNVQQWADRSGNNWHAVQGIAGRLPQRVAAGLNGLRIVRADGTNDNLSLHSSARSLYAGVGTGWMFCVIKKTGADVAATSRRVFVFTNNATGVRFGLYWDDATSGAQNRIVVGARREDGGAYNRLASSATSSDTWALVYAEVNWIARTIRLFIDGELDGTLTGAFDASGVTSATTSTDASLFASPTTIASWGGDSAAMLCGVTLPDTGDINRLAGYYAHRFDLTGNLDASHPYKTSPP